MRTGVVAMVGKPNVGKSTLLNAIVGQKVSIVSNKPQTTRKRALGIANGPGYQIAFIDTPGLHEPNSSLGRAMVNQAKASLTDVDAILYVADGSHHPGEQDQAIAAIVHQANDGPEAKPVILCLNKMDLLKAENVQRNIDAYCALFATEEYMLTTATRGENVDKLLAMLTAHMPEGEPAYELDDFTDQSSRFLAGELVREKILRATRQEIPHAVAVLVDSWQDEGHIIRIAATILVEKPSQRAILIGKQGQFLKSVGTQAREDIEEMLDRKVYLDLHVKVSEGWRMNPSLLRELEYSD